jgi:hypothetical protein
MVSRTLAFPFVISLASSLAGDSAIEPGITDGFGSTVVVRGRGCGRRVGWG